MNRKEIIKLAMDIDGHMNDYPGGINLKWDTLVKIVQKAIKDERELCAKVCEQDEFQIYETAERCAAAIRARGEK